VVCVTGEGVKNKGIPRELEVRRGNLTVREDGGPIVKKREGGVTKGTKQVGVSLIQAAGGQVLKYQSIPEDRLWAKSGVVATVATGESMLSIQQRVEDAGFTSVVVNLMGGDRVFLHCSHDVDVWKVINDAIDFFSMLFSNLHSWSAKDALYERGAWLRVYGIPMHAWNINFFNLCVAKCGRFIRVDECTSDKARLDYARILISTTSLEVLNTTTEFLIDGCIFTIKLIEEWRCHLGEDAFLSEEVIDVPSIYKDDGSVRSEDFDIDEAQGDVDVLLQDINKEWGSQVVGCNRGTTVHSSKTTTILDVDVTAKAEACVLRDEQQTVEHSVVVKPKQQQQTMEHTNVVTCSKKQQQSVESEAVLSTKQQPLVHNLVNGSITSGPWSFEFLKTKGVVADAIKPSLNSNHIFFNGKKDVRVVKLSARNMRRVARMSVNDRGDILKTLKKQAKKRKVRTSSHSSKSKEPMLHSFPNTHSDSSNSSGSSVNKDYENWINLKGTVEATTVDVENIGRVIGVKYNGDVMNKFNILYKEGRHQMQAVVGKEVSGWEVEGSSRGEAGC